MRNNILLTSLIAISVAFGAHAETDVTFAGNYTVQPTTYQYTNTAGETITAASNEAPDLTQFTYTINGVQYDFSDGYDLTAHDFNAPSHADGVTVFGPETIYANQPAQDFNYEYINGNGERVAYIPNPSLMEVVFLDSSAYYGGGAVFVSNASTGFYNGTSYYADVSGTRYYLSEDASQLVTGLPMMGMATPVDISDNAELTELYNNMYAAYLENQEILQPVIDAQLAQMDNSPEHQATAQVVMQDTLMKMGLSTEYNTFNEDTKPLFEAAQEAQAAAAQEASELSEAEAMEVYNAPILETIRNTSNQEIAESIENGAIGDAIAASENTLRNEYRSADELVLKSAKAYTDKKVSKLEDTLSAGIASSAALSSVAVSNVKRGELSVGGGYGNYNSKSAFALGAAMGLTNNWSVNAGAGMDSNGDHVAFRAGTNYKFKLF
jgi:hypothetical protein